jgi:methionyl-tRNA formyltransferase
MITIVYMGTPEFAVPALNALVGREDINVALVVSQPDRPAGRGGKLKSPAVIEAARHHGLQTWQPESLKPDEAFEQLKAVKADLYVVAAYGEILRQRVLDLPIHGALNIHGSLLPRWRGAAPIQWSIASGDATAGVSLMKMERGLDSGPVYAMSATMVGESMTSSDLHDHLASDGAALLDAHLITVMDGATPATQDFSRVTHARMLTRDDRSLDPALSAAAQAWWINGMSPWPGVTVKAGDDALAMLRARPTRHTTDRPAHVVEVRDGIPLVSDGRGAAFELLQVRRPGKKVVSGRDWVNGEAVDGLQLEPNS